MKYRELKDILEEKFPKKGRYHYFEDYPFFTILSGGAATTAFLKTKTGSMDPWLAERIKNDPIVKTVNDLDIKIVFNNEATYDDMTRFIVELNRFLVGTRDNAIVFDVSKPGQIVQIESPDGDIDIHVSHIGIWGKMMMGRLRSQRQTPSTPCYPRFTTFGLCISS